MYKKKPLCWHIPDNRAIEKLLRTMSYPFHYPLLDSSCRNYKKKTKYDKDNKIYFVIMLFRRFVEC